MFKIVGYIFYFILIASCKNIKSPDDEKEINVKFPSLSKIVIEPPFTEAEEKKWDSIRYFKDIIYTSNKGVHSLKKSELEYPFAAISYKKNSVRVSAFFNKAESYHNYYTEEYGMLKSTVDSIYKDDEGMYYYYLRYFSKNGFLYQIGYCLFPNIDITSISKIYSISTDTTKLTGYSYDLLNKLSIKDALKFDEKMLKKGSRMGSRGGRLTTIENYVEYSLYDSYKDYKDQKTKLRETKYNSYFFDDYYETLQEKKR